MRNPVFDSLLVCVLWLLWCFGGSTVDFLGGTEQCIVVFYVVIVGVCVVCLAAFGLAFAVRTIGVVGLVGWLNLALEVSFHEVPFKAVLCRGEPKSCRS